MEYSGRRAAPARQSGGNFRRRRTALIPAVGGRVPKPGEEAFLPLLRPPGAFVGLSGALVGLAGLLLRLPGLAAGLFERTLQISRQRQQFAFVPEAHPALQEGHFETQLAE